MSSSRVNLELYMIPLEEIRRATGDFSQENLIGEGGFGKVYKGKLSERWENRTVAFKRLDRESYQGVNEFRNEIEMRSNFNHENIISLIGYCDEGNEMIIVSEYATGGSLDGHLHDPNRRRNLTWAHRLKICLTAARGLEYLHDGLGEDGRVIHRDIKSAKVLLDHKMEAKISSFGLSRSVDRNRPHAYTHVAGTHFYIDPIYMESGVADIKSDVYSFGIVLFEMLSGMLAHVERVSANNNDQPQKLINLVRRYYDVGILDNFVDPLIKDQINIRSLLVFKEIAYQCISWNLKDRPMMNKIIERIQEALDIQKREGFGDTIRTHQPLNVEGFQIPFEEISRATENFSSHNIIGDGGFGKVYKGNLSIGWQNQAVAIKRLAPDAYQGAHEFYNEIQLISRTHHQNIIPLVGYCDQEGEMILVFEYIINGSLDRHLHDPKKMCCLTWVQRLKICVGVARGLEYLHSGLEGDTIIIHRDIKSGNILFDDDNEPKICDFGLSLLVDRNQPQVYVAPAGTNFYMDPVYRESGILEKESDIFSFGVVLLEVLSGRLAYQRRPIGDGPAQSLIHLVRRYYDNEPDILIDSLIRDEIDSNSFRVFMKIAYRCISYNLKDRPTMKRIIKRIEEALKIQAKKDMAQGATSTILTRSPQHQDLKSFQIPLVDIIFSREPDNRIGDGGFGKVYKGKLSKGFPNYTVAVKCLDPKGHQGKKEFLTEVDLISSFNHQNIIPFVGYCDDGDEMIIVSIYATNGSVDHHLRDPSRRNCLTWAHRLKICLGAAKGLDYLHSGLGKVRVIHRDVKSANILLDEELEAKLCDFGLSKKGTINHHTQIYTKAAGTEFYLDPVYHESGILSKESDVYSFGVVLFEMLSGRLAYHPTTFVDGSPQYLIILVRRYYNHEPKKLIDHAIRDEIDSQCFDTFINLAYKCISLKSDERPTMDTIIDGIEDAMEFQKLQV